MGVGWIAQRELEEAEGRQAHERDAGVGACLRTRERLFGCAARGVGVTEVSVDERLGVEVGGEHRALFGQCGDPQSLGGVALSER